MYSQQFTLCYSLVKSLLLRICLRHQSVIPFLSGAPPPKKNPVSGPVLFLLAVREKPNPANLNKFAACGVWAPQVTTLYRINPCCECIFFVYNVSVQFVKKCNPPWSVGRNLISWAIKPPNEGGEGGLWGRYSSMFIILLFFFMPRGSAPRPKPLAFRILFWTKKRTPFVFSNFHSHKMHLFALLDLLTDLPIHSF